MTPVEVKSKIELSKFRKFWMSKFFKRPTTLLFYLLMILLNFVSAFGFIPFFLAFFGILGAALLPIFILFKVRKMFKSNPFFREEISYLFEEQSLTISYQDRKDSYNYTDLHKIEVDGDFVLVYLTQLVAFYIDGDAFNSENSGQPVFEHLDQLVGVNFVND